VGLDVRVEQEFEDPVHNATLWDTLMKKYVTENQTKDGIRISTVDYMGIVNDTDFEAYLKSLETANITNLNRTETYAFFINVYNALAINMIISNACAKDIFGNCGPIIGIEEIGTLVPYKSVWDKPAGIVAGSTWTLDDVENYLRAPPNMKEDPRLHAAIVCASVSCPNVRKGAYTIQDLDDQLTENFNDFLSNAKKGMLVDQQSKTVTLSSIFNWFSADFINFFNNTSQASNATVITFILQYLSPNDSDFQFLLANQNASLKYFRYDWNVNTNGKLPCTSHSRPCFTVLWLLVTLGILLIIVIIIVIVVVVVKKRKKSGYEELKPKKFIN